MPKLAAVVIPIAAASAVGFVLHRAVADHFPAWVGERMSGVSIKQPPYGPEVVVPAALSSVEYGVAFFLAYLLVRRSFPNLSVWLRAVAVTALCLALGGNLVRMPLMQLVVGNPLLVTLVQHAGIWMPYLVASFVLAFTYEWLVARQAQPRVQPDPPFGAVLSGGRWWRRAG